MTIFFFIAPICGGSQWTLILINSLEGLFYREWFCFVLLSYRFDCMICHMSERLKQGTNIFRGNLGVLTVSGITSYSLKHFKSSITIKKTCFRSIMMPSIWRVDAVHEAEATGIKKQNPLVSLDSILCFWVFRESIISLLSWGFFKLKSF